MDAVSVDTRLEETDHNHESKTHNVPQGVSRKTTTTTAEETGTEDNNGQTSKMDSVAGGHLQQSKTRNTTSETNTPARDIYRTRDATMGGNNTQEVETGNRGRRTIRDKHITNKGTGKGARPKPLRQAHEVKAVNPNRRGTRESKHNEKEKG